MTRTSEKTGRSAAPLSVKIFRGFALLTIIIIVLLWLFQALFFGKIYAVLKHRDIERCTEYLAECAAGGDLDEGAAYAAKKYDCCVSVYRVEIGRAHV